MSSEWRAPAPLPMYQPVVLKHVPTMVRRRYDHLDVDDLLSDQPQQPQPQPQPQDAPTDDDDDDDDDVDGHIENDQDLDLIDQDAPTSGDSSTHQGGRDGEDDDLEDSNSTHEVDTSVSVECQQSEVANSIQDCETETQNGSIKPTDIQSENSECGDDGSEAVNPDPIVEGTLEDETGDKRLTPFGNELGSVSEDDGCDRSEIEHLEFIDTDVKDETLDNGMENSSDDQDSCQSQDDSQQDYNLSGEVDASVSAESQHTRLVNSTDDCVKRTYSESISNGSTGQRDLDSENSKSKDDGSNVANHAPTMDSNPHEDESPDAKHKRIASFSNEQVLHSKYHQNEDDGAKVADHAPTMVTGRLAPPPLPMYHPVALHHVPTMVRRRYEHFDTEKLDQIEDEPKSDGEDDGDLDSINNEDNLVSENSSCEQGSALEDDDCDGSDMKHSSCIVDSSVKGWREGEDDDLQDSNPSSEVDDGISVECQLNVEENSTDNFESGTYCESAGTRSIKLTELDSKGSQVKDNWPKVANHAPGVDSNLDEDETTHKRLAFLSNDQALHPENSESDNGVPKLFNHVPVVEFNHENEMQDKRLIDVNYEEGSSADQNKGVCHLSEGNSPLCAKVSLNIEAEEMGLGSFDDKQDIVYKTEASKKSIEEDRFKFQGRCSPPPLPMYRPVVLKHVPTIVRKRYERADAEPLHQIEDVPTNDGEFEDDGDLDDEGGLLSENISSEQVESQQNGVENSIDDCETGIYNESVSSRDIQPTDLHQENIESEDDESKVGDSAPVVDSSLDEGETQDKRPSLALHSEYSENKDDAPEFAYHAPIVDSNLENEIQDKRLVDFSNEQGNSKDEYNGAEDANTGSYPSTKYDSLDVTDRNSTDEQGLHLEDNKRDADISEGNSSFCTTASLKSEAEVIECGSFNDDEQDTIPQTYTEDFGTQNFIQRSLDNMNLKIECSGSEDTNSSCNMHTAVRTEVQDEVSQWDSNYQKEFKPETLRTIMEENGFELFCPNCKHCFTNPLIVQRKENGQHCRTSCFTGLVALFCGGRD